MKLDEIINEAKKVVLDDGMFVFENPTRQHIDRLLVKYKELRGAASNGGPLYVWDANSWVHHTISKRLGYEAMTYYYYFSKTPHVQSSEWIEDMEPYHGIYIGAKYEEDDVLRPDIAMKHKMIVRL